MPAHLRRRAVTAARRANARPVPGNIRDPPIGRQPAHLAIAGVGDVEVARAVGRQPVGKPERRARPRTSVAHRPRRPAIGRGRAGAGHGRDDPVGADPAHDVEQAVGDEQVPERVVGDPRRLPKLGLRGRTAVAAVPVGAVAGDSRDDVVAGDRRDIRTRGRCRGEHEHDPQQRDRDRPQSIKRADPQTRNNHVNSNQSRWRTERRWTVRPAPSRRCPQPCNVG
jgi:hypothetical protein